VGPAPAGCELADGEPDACELADGLAAEEVSSVPLGVGLGLPEDGDGGAESDGGDVGEDEWWPVGVD
jgi:hypothetical protein